MIKQTSYMEKTEKADTGALYFLMVLMVLIITLAIFKSEVIALVLKITEAL